MTFKNPAMNFIQIAATIGALQQLSTLLDLSNGNARWNLLQEWLKKNPDKQQMIETAASLPADQALAYLLNQMNLDVNLLKQYDPQGQITHQAETALAELQKLYKGRKEFDRQDGRRLGSAGKIRKEKSLKNAFHDMNNLCKETIN